MTMQQALEPSHDRDWLLEANSYDPIRESSLESRFAVSNGFLGVRGSRAISRGPTWVSWLHTVKWASWPRTYVAGLFDNPNTEPSVPALVPVADWLRLRIIVDGKPLLHRSGDMLFLRRTLDMRRGVLLTEWRQRDPGGVEILTRTLRLVSLADRAVGLQLVQVEVEQGHAKLVVEARFDQAGSGLDLVHMEQNLGVWRTEQSGKGLAMAGAASLQLNDAELPFLAEGPFKGSWTWTSAPAQVACFQRLLAVARSDEPGQDPRGEALAALDRARGIGWRGALAAHEAAWAERWRLSDIEIEGDATTQRALRFGIYHLNSAANPADERVSIGARALTGDAYLGHVFWDTEIYLLPFYVATWPAAARALLMYRYHTLPGARRKAARMGWRGAMYAWEFDRYGRRDHP